VDRDGNVLGAIGFGWESPQRYGAAQRARLRTVAEIAAQSLQRAQLYEAERRGRERVALMADVTAAVSGTGSLADRLERLCELLVPRFADLATAELLDQDGRPATPAVTHANPAAFAALRALADHAIRAGAPHAGGRTSERGAPRMLSDVPEATLAECTRDPEALALLREIAPRSYVEVPLRAGTTLVGRLILAHTRSGRRFDGEELAFACELGERAGLLLDNARLVEAEHEIAAELQQRLLPSSLSTPSCILVAARYRPADARLGVGGDWYDVVELPDGKLAIAVGDVVGHGPRAAATMGQLRSAFAALAPAAEGPSEVLHRLDAFAARTPDAQFGSVCVAVLDPRTCTLRYACAGHPPPLIVHPDGSIETLEHGRSPLISAGHEVRGEAVARLPAGARLVVFTDGLVERRTASIDAGLQRLDDAARRHRECAIEELCDALLADMLADEPTRDDTALLCIELLPLDAAGGEPRAWLQEPTAARTSP
jgi:GAF domain-containing protein